MALMERIATLLRANVNDLIERAEDPEKLLKQLVLDMEDGLRQLKTQVARALASQHLLEGKAREEEAATAEWQRRAELAVSRGEDGLARAALERALTQERTLAAFRAEAADQAAESEALHSTYTRLGGKLAETQAQCQLLIAQHRRAGIASEAAKARSAVEEGIPGASHAATISRAQSRIREAEAENYAAQAMLPGEAGNAGASLEDRFAALDREERVEGMLAELKSRQKSKQSRILPAS